MWTRCTQITNENENRFHSLILISYALSPYTDGWKKMKTKIEDVFISQFASDHPPSPLDIRFHNPTMESPKILLFDRKWNPDKSNLNKKKVGTKAMELKRMSKGRTMNGRASSPPVL